MIYERFQRYSHLPHQVANDDINCYDAKLSKYQCFLENNYVKKCINRKSIYMIISHITIKY